MKIATESHGTTTILRPTGPPPSQLSFLLRDRVTEAVTGGARHVVLDFSEISTLDSLGIGEIVAAYTAARTRDVAISLVGLSARVQRVMATSNLHSILPVFPTVEEAEAAAAVGTAAGR